MKKERLLLNLSVIIFLTVAFGLPFINQAYHIDDTNFLYITKQILKDPLRPYSFDINWRGVDEGAFDILANPLLCPYYSALVIKVFGESEPALHGAYLLFAALAAVFMFFLANRFVKYALVSALLLICAPAFMVMSHTVMPDTALLAFYLGGITLFIYGIDGDKSSLLVLSGVFMGLAGLCRYSGLTVFFIAIMYVLLCSRKFDKKAIMPFLVAGVIFFIWCLHNFMIYKQLHFLKASGFQLVTLTFEAILCKIEALLVYAGSTTVFFIFFIAGFLKREYKNAFFLLATASLHFAIITAMKYDAILSKVFLITVFMLSCLYFLFIALDRIIIENATSVKKEYVFLLAWIFFIVLFTSTVYFAAVKHILLFLPALIILFVSIVEKILGSRVKVYLSAAVLLTLLSGFSISYADYKYADVYRDFAVKNVPKYRTPTNTVWFVGHWGFQYYMEKLGCKALPYSDNSPKKGDILIMPILIAEHQWPCKLLQDRLVLLNTIGYALAFPLRTMNARENFSFYTNIMLGWNPGFLPYYFSNQRLEQFVVYQVID